MKKLKSRSILPVLMFVMFMFIMSSKTIFADWNVVEEVNEAVKSHPVGDEDIPQAGVPNWGEKAKLEYLVVGNIKYGNIKIPIYNPILLTESTFEVHEWTIDDVHLNQNAVKEMINNSSKFTSNKLKALVAGSNSDNDKLIAKVLIELIAQKLGRNENTIEENLGFTKTGEKKGDAIVDLDFELIFYTKLSMPMQYDPKYALEIIGLDIPYTNKRPQNLILTSPSAEDDDSMVPFDYSGGGKFVAYVPKADYVAIYNELLYKITENNKYPQDNINAMKQELYDRYGVTFIPTQGVAINFEVKEENKSKALKSLEGTITLQNYLNNMINAQLYQVATPDGFSLITKTKTDCKVTYMVEDKVDHEETVKKGDKAKGGAPKNPPYDKTFAHWSETKGGKVGFNFQRAIEKDMTLYAVFEEDVNIPNTDEKEIKEPSIEFSPESQDWTNKKYSVSITYKSPTSKYWNPNSWSEGYVIYNKSNCVCHRVFEGYADGLDYGCVHEGSFTQYCTRNTKDGKCSELIEGKKCDCSHEKDCTHQEAGTNPCDNGKLKCSICNDTGSRTCDNCHGSKIINCTKCSSKGSTACQVCGGDGLIACTAANCSNGKYYCGQCSSKGSTACQVCGGDGKLNNGSKCKAQGCSGGRITCPFCQGKGGSSCNTCGGDGLVACKAQGCSNGGIDCPFCDGGTSNCTTCLGTGKVTCTIIKNKTCPECKGSGTVGDVCKGHFTEVSITPSTTDSIEKKYTYVNAQKVTVEKFLTCTANHTHLDYCWHHAHSYPYELFAERMSSESNKKTFDVSEWLGIYKMTFEVSKDGSKFVKATMNYEIDEGKIEEDHIAGLSVDESKFEKKHNSESTYEISSKKAMDPLKKSSGPYKLDTVKPIIYSAYSNNYKPGDWTNENVELNIQAYDVNLNGANEISQLSKFTFNSGEVLIKSGKPSSKNADDNIDITNKYASWNKTYSKSGTYILQFEAADTAGNLVSYAPTIKVDKIPPTINYAFDSAMVVKNDKKGRYETTAIGTNEEKPGFYLNVQDCGNPDQISGIDVVKYKVLTKSQLNNSDIPILRNDGNDVSDKFKSSTSNYIFIEIEDKFKRCAEDVYLAVYAKDVAGNETYTVSGVMSLSSGEIVSGGKTINPALKTNYYNKSDTNTATLPVAKIFVNSGGTPNNDEDGNPDDEINSAKNSVLSIIKVADVNWQNSIIEPVYPINFAISRNKINDAIGLGYNVYFKYDTIGYNTDEGDKTVVTYNVYGYYNGEMKKLDIYSDTNAKITDKYSTFTYIVPENRRFYDPKTVVNMDTPQYTLSPDGNTASLYFNYYIPANATFRLKDQNVIVKPSEIVVKVTVESYKHMNTSNSLLYNYLNDNNIKWHTTEGTFPTFYGTGKIAAGIGKGQAFWYDVNNTAITDIQGHRN